MDKSALLLESTDISRSTGFEDIWRATYHLYRWLGSQGYNYTHFSCKGSIMIIHTEPMPIGMVKEITNSDNYASVVNILEANGYEVIHRPDDLSIYGYLVTGQYTKF